MKNKRQYAREPYDFILIIYTSYIKTLKSCPQSNGLVNFWPENEKREVTDFGVWSFEQGELLE